ncbi:Bzrap1 [Acrasis kona]|uniref:Bzrap1 n=1 Tax=Acrasis kona TaxID=1008807 RepID=A0AAW2ZAG9_9EUKA
MALNSYLDTEDVLDGMKSESPTTPRESKREERRKKRQLIKLVADETENDHIYTPADKSNSQSDGKLRDELEKLGIDYKTLLIKCERLVIEKEQSVVEAEKLTNEHKEVVDGLKEEINRLKKQQEGSTRRHQKRNEKLNDELNKLKLKAESDAQIIEKFNTKYINESELLKEVQGENDMLRGQISDESSVSKAVDESNRKLESLQQEYDEQTKLVQTLQEQIQTHVDQTQHLNTELEKYKGIEEKHLKEKEMLKQDIEQLQRNIDQQSSAKKEHEQDEVELVGLRQFKTKAENEAKEHSVQVNDLQKQIKELTTQIKDLEQAKDLQAKTDNTKEPSITVQSQHQVTITTTEESNEVTNILQKVQSNDPTLTKINLQSKNINSQQAILLCEAIRNNSKINEIDFSKNPLIQGQQCIDSICDLLDANNHIQNLYLDDTKLINFSRLLNCIKQHTNLIDVTLPDAATDKELDELDNILDAR